MQGAVGIAFKGWFEDAATRLGVVKPADWHNIKITELSKLEGNNMSHLWYSWHSHKYTGADEALGHYGHSLYNALTSIYPRHRWARWKLERSSSPPKSFWSDDGSIPLRQANNDDTLWSDIKKQRYFFDWLGMCIHGDKIQGMTYYCSGKQLELKELDDWYYVSKYGIIIVNLLVSNVEITS